MQDPTKSQWEYVNPNPDGSYDTKIDFSNYNLREDFVAASCPPMFEPVEQCPWCKKQLRRVLDWPYYNWLVCDNEQCPCKSVRIEHKLDYIPVVHWCNGCMNNFRSETARKFCSNASYSNDKWHPHQVLDSKKVVKDTRSRAEVVSKDIPANPDPPFPEDHDDESNEAPKDNALPSDLEFAFKEAKIDSDEVSIPIQWKQSNLSLIRDCKVTLLPPDEPQVVTDLRKKLNEEEDMRQRLKMVLEEDAKEIVEKILNEVFGNSSTQLE